MSQSLGLAEPATQIWSVGELTAYIRELFDIDYRLQEAWVEGEISNFSQARSGHVYFTLKDDQAQLKCVMWRSAVSRLQHWPEDGDAVMVIGRISVYEAGGVYQLYADRLEPIGRGSLALAFEQLKEQLAAEGLFDESHKQLIPTFPRKLGIVTSPDAAALQDILNVLRRRWPLIEVLIAPTLVQGREAPSQIASAVSWLDGRADIDTILIARGGGSMEDLWSFNDETVARAIFSARHPTIVGVGHQTDFTIADFVADVRAPTPSAAAELAVPDWREVAGHLASLGGSLAEAMRYVIGRHDERLHDVQRRLQLVSPRMRIDNGRQNMDVQTARMERAMVQFLERKKSRLEVAQTGLDAVSPLATLNRGYAIVFKTEGQLVRSIDEVSTGDSLDIRVSDGNFGATVS